MAKIKDVAGGFFNNDTIYSPNGFTRGKAISNAIVDNVASNMQNEIQQGENFGAKARKNKKEDDKSSISKTVVIGSPLPSKKEIAAKGKADKKAFSKSLKDSKDFAYKKAAELNTQADELEQEASDTEDEDEKRDLLKQAKSLRAEAERRRKDADITYNKTTKKETLVSPDSGHSGPTAEAADTSAPGTISDNSALHGRRASDTAPKLKLPTARPGLLEDKANAEKTLTEKRNERDEFIKTARQDKKTAKRNMREQSIIPDDFDFDFEDEFDSTDPFIASLFKKGKINKLLIAATIKKMIDGSAHESVTKVMNDKRAALEKKQNRSLKEQLFLDAFNMIERGIVTEEKTDRLKEKTDRLKGEVKNARDNLSTLNAELREHERAVDRARSNSYKGGRKSKTEYKNGWAITHVSGDGAAAQYASRMEERDGKKMYVTYSVTAGSPDTQRDPVRIAEYQEYNGMRNPNIMDVENFAENNLKQVEGGFENAKAAAKEAQDSKDFKTFDGQNYFDYSGKHKVIATKALKLIIDRGGKVDRETGKIYSVSKDDFPEGADELYLDYGTAYKLAKGNDEEVAKLTGMSLDEVKARKIVGMIRDYSIGDARVTVDAQGRVIYQLPEENKTALSGANGRSFYINWNEPHNSRSFYINWNEPHNRKVVEEYAKMGKTKQDIPLSELKTVNTSRSAEGNIDWTDTKKTKAAEKAQTDQYTGAYKPSASVLDALIGFRRK